MSEVKIMQSEIDKMIQEEVEDYAFLNEVRKPEKEASMRIAKTRVKEIIQEELDRYAKLEHDEKFFSSPEKVEEDWSTSEFTDNEAENDGLKIWQNLKMSPLFAKQEPNFKEEFSDIEDALMGNKEKVGSAQAAFSTLVTHLGLEGTNVERALRVVENEIENLSEGLLDKLKTGVGKLTKTPDASERFPHGDLYDVWVDVGEEVKAVSERYFNVIADDYYYVLDMLKGAEDPNGEIWKDEKEDSGYAPDLRFHKLTNNQYDVIGSIGRVKRDIDRLIELPAEEFVNSEAWQDLVDEEYFDKIAQWVKELEPPVDFTGKHEGLSQDVDEGFFPFRAGQKKKESPLPGEGGAHDVDAFKGRVKDAIRRTYARPEEGAPADWESAIAESILKEINATYEASWKPTHVRGEELPNLGINLMEFFVATQRVVGGFFGRDMAEEIMAKLEPSMEALEADSKERQAALKADLDTAENF